LVSAGQATACSTWLRTARRVPTVTSHSARPTVTCTPLSKRTTGSCDPAPHTPTGQMSASSGQTSSTNWSNQPPNSSNQCEGGRGTLPGLGEAPRAAEMARDAGTAEDISSASGSTGDGRHLVCSMLSTQVKSGTARDAGTRSGLVLYHCKGPRRRIEAAMAPQAGHAHALSPCHGRLRSLQIRHVANHGMDRMP
jgi:hypothetical protein